MDPEEPSRFVPGGCGDDPGRHRFSFLFHYSLDRQLNASRHFGLPDCLEHARQRPLVPPMQEFSGLQTKVIEKFAIRGAPNG
jgi:hypothetical protein